jgi:hypothetical protein
MRRLRSLLDIRASRVEIASPRENIGESRYQKRTFDFDVYLVCQTDAVAAKFVDGATIIYKGTDTRSLRFNREHVQQCTCSWP